MPWRSGASPNGSRVFVTGLSLGSGVPVNDDYATVGYDAATGAQVWVKRYNGPVNGLDVAYGVAVSPDGSKVFVTGESQLNREDYFTLAYAAA